MAAHRATRLAGAACAVIAASSLTACSGTTEPPAAKTLVSAEAIPTPEGFPTGTTAHRIAYRSTTASGAATTVTGVTLVPPDPDPQRPVVAWAHGTTGIGDDCAPSADPALAGYGPLLGAFLDAGYAVTATDYEGLGTPGDHPYLISASEARSVLDSVRAIRDLDPRLGARWVGVGHSQGGHAVLAAAELAGRGAGPGPAGTVAYAPAPNLTDEVDRLDQAVPPEQALYTMMLIGLRTRHPDLDPADFLGPRARQLLEPARTECVDALVTRFTRADLPGSEFAPKDPARLREWFSANEIGRHRASGPVLVAQGGADRIVFPEYTDALVGKARAQGTDVDHRVYPGADHGGVLTAAQRDVLAWLAAR